LEPSRLQDENAVGPGSEITVVCDDDEGKPSSLTKVEEEVVQATAGVGDRKSVV
jgi:hypothetical protein